MKNEFDGYLSEAEKEINKAKDIIYNLKHYLKFTEYISIQTIAELKKAADRMDTVHKRRGPEDPLAIACNQVESYIQNAASELSNLDHYLNYCIYHTDQAEIEFDMIYVCLSDAKSILDKEKEENDE